MAAIHMKNSPLVSVCIANYNGMGVIDACLRSVMEQQGDFPVEIIVHDDASSDDSVHHIRANYPNVTILESDENVGFCISNNRMVAEAKGEYLLLLNNDAELFTDALTTFVNEAKKFGKPAIFGLPQYNAETGTLIDRGSLFDPFLNPIPNLDVTRQEVGMVMGSCLWLPRDLWNELGGFPEWFESIGEDLYLCCKASLLGYGVYVCNKAGFRHWVGRSFGGGKINDKKLVSTFLRRCLSERNKTFTMIAIYPIHQLVWVLPIHLFLLVVEGLVMSSFGHNIPFFKWVTLNTIISPWKFKSNLYKLRQDVQKRKVSDSLFKKCFIRTHYKLRLVLKYGLPEVI